MDREHAFIHDDGSSVSLRVYETSGLAPRFAAEIQRIFSTFNEQLIADMTTTCCCNVFGSTSSAITTRQNDRFLIRSLCLKGVLYEMWDKTVPEDSISAKIVENLRPILWSAGGKNQNTAWFYHPYMLGVPCFDEDGTLAGTLVLSCEEEPHPIEEHIFMMELVAEAYMLAQRNAKSYRDAFKTGKILEQERIAQELHDTAVQNMFSVGMKAHGILQRGDLNDEQRAAIGELTGIVTETDKILRKVVFSDPREDEHIESLQALIDEEVEAHLSVGGARTTAVIELQEEPPVRLYPIVRIVSHEALLNIRKHARATAVVLSCTMRGGFLYLSIQDDGVGIGPRPAQGHWAAAPVDVRENESRDERQGLHFGLENLERLVAANGGSLNIDGGEDGCGTTLLVRLPLEECYDA